MVIENKTIIAAAKLQWDTVLPDILSLLLYTFFLDKMMQWQEQHPALSCTLLMVLNCIAVGLGCFTFFRVFSNDKELTAYRNALTTLESAALGLSAFVSVIGFLWWLVPFAWAKEMGVRNTGFIAGAVIYFIVFLSVVAGSLAGQPQKIRIPVPAIKAANILFTTLFFFFSYSFLLVSLRYWNPSFVEIKLLAVICLVVFYLPLRFFLLLRPPRHRLEYVVFILSFVCMLYTLFARL